MSQNQKKWTTFDVGSAVIKAPLKECVYADQLDGFAQAEKKDWVYVLKKILLELRQSLSERYYILHAFLEAFDFVQSKKTRRRMYGISEKRLQ